MTIEIVSRYSTRSLCAIVCFLVTLLYYAVFGIDIHRTQKKLSAELQKFAETDGNAESQGVMSHQLRKLNAERLQLELDCSDLKEQRFTSQSWKREWSRLTKVQKAQRLFELFQSNDLRCRSQQYVSTSEDTSLASNNSSTSSLALLEGVDISRVLQVEVLGTFPSVHNMLAGVSQELIGVVPLSLTMEHNNVASPERIWTMEFLF